MAFKQYPMPTVFSSIKFAARYGLSAINGDFFVDGKGMLNVPDNLRDDPPIFELPDPPQPSITSDIDNLLLPPNFSASLKAVLKRLAKGN